MAKSKIKIIECPVCGSKKVKKDGDNHYACLSCQAAFFIDTPQPNINHRHYNKTPIQQPLDKKKMMYLIGGIAFIFFFSTIVPAIFRSCKSTPTNQVTNTSVKKENLENQYEFTDYKYYPFVDASGNIKLFIIGKINKARGRDEAIRENYFWSVYDVKSDKMGAVNMLDINGEPVKNWTMRTDLKLLDDGNIYIVYNSMHLFKFDIHTQTVRYLNNDILEKSSAMKTGIARIKEYLSWMNFFTIVSNSSKEIQYSPVSNYIKDTKVEDALFSQAPNPNPQTRIGFVPTMSEPSYLVKFTSQYTLGYPADIEPDFRVKMNDDETFNELVIRDYQKLRSHILDFEVLNTNNYQYKMEVIDYRDNLVAIGVKNTNNHEEPYIIQLLDYEGNLKWAATSQSSNLDFRRGALSPTEGVLVPKCCGEFEHFDIQGKSIRNFDVDDIRFLYK